MERKTTTAQINHIWQAHQEGCKPREIARTLKLSRARVEYYIRRGEAARVREEQWGGLSTRAVNAFRMAGIETLDAALKLPATEILGLRNAGIGTVAEVEAARTKQAV